MKSFSPGRVDDDHSEGSSSPDVASSSGEESQTGNDSTNRTDDGTSSSEARAVRRSRLLVFTALVLTAAIGTLIYLLMSNQEWTTCQQNFHAYSKEIATNSDSQVATIFSHVSTLATAVTSHALNYNMTFPNVTLPNFDARARDMGESTLLPLVFFVPVVRDSDRAGWEAFTETQHWIEQDLKYQADKSFHPGPMPPKIYSYSKDLYKADASYGTAPEDEGEEESELDALEGGGGVGRVSADDFESSTEFKDQDYSFVAGNSFPLWQFGPLPRNASIMKMDLATNPSFKKTIATVMRDKRDFFSSAMDLHFLYNSQGWQAGDVPRSTAVIPVREDFYEDSPVRGLVVGTVKWSELFERVLPPDVKGIVAAVEDSCGRDFAFIIEGEDVVLLGYGTAENFTVTANSRFRESFEIAEAETDNDHEAGTIEDDAGRRTCEFTLTLYSTQVYEAACTTSMPAVYTTVVVMVFLATIVTFALYDFLVSRRQRKLMAQAKRSDAIVSSLFPKHVQQRMMEEAEPADTAGKWKSRLTSKQQHVDFHHDGTLISPEGARGSRPIADLYAESTIIFADIVGFTQWSSCRVPSDVFTLLESIFAAFDEAANCRRVYKVETVGDCYVAACGVPEPRKDHALVMARFARECLVAFHEVVRKLESQLGPDTADLGIRVGLHSGPVTAGVLRGERSRFQLFGDTMNTCSRIETTGEKNRIHISRETAELLIAHGKSHWCRKREDSVAAKGKGVLSTFWLEVKGESAQSTHSSTQDTENESGDPNEAASTRLEDVCFTSVVTKEGMPSDMMDRIQRLVKWNVDLLARKLCTVVARRQARKVKSAPRALIMKFEQGILAQRTMVLDEVKDVITLPVFDADDDAVETEGVPVDLGPAVSEQLHSYLMTIALLYRDNSFHCFEHATHVTMSVVKLLSRVVEEGHRRDRVAAGNTPGALEEDLRCHAYGITSDPLTQFAMVFSALIHDVEHKGLPNAQLVKENDPIAAAYQSRSPAEQNSIDIAWSLLMKEEYQDLRAAIYATPDELARFRQLVVNAVMATDIMDKDLGLARKARWNKAFSESPAVVSAEYTNRKATIVLEHLIQASDVAHTMQHWNIYRKWNARFFEESYKAFLEGRAGANPADSWFDGELGFFDFYIIPLAMKLKDCGVFGVSSDEYLNYAQQNRREWESRGRELVEEMVQAAQITFRGEGEKSSRIAI